MAYQMKEYNGFSGAERMIVQQIMNELQQRDIINWKDQKCSVCGGSGGEIQAHLEDYTKVFDFHPICIECHMKLHMRLRYPGYWIKHLVDVKNGYVSHPYKTGREWFASKKGKFSLPDFDNLDPALLGNEWFHKLPMKPRNLNRYIQYGNH